MSTRLVPFARGVVLACAAVLSFSALYDLAVLCGFHRWLAVLFPVMVDAGAAVALAGWRAQDETAWFARRMMCALLVTTVLGNAVAHFLDAYQLQPHWTIVVLVGALAPAILLATWFLRSLDARRRQPEPDVQKPVQKPDPVATEQDIPARQLRAVTPTPVLDGIPGDVLERARVMALEGNGRTVILRELGPQGLTEYQAKQLLSSLKNRTNGQAVTA